MSSFSMSPSDGWFRLGRLEVTSTIAVVLLGAIGIVVSAFVPGLTALATFIPSAVLDGQVWRLVTWPWLDQVSLWSLVTLVMLWFFGGDLEREIGRRPMAWLYVGCWAILTVLSLGIGLLLGGGFMLGLGSIQLLLILLWIADNPRRPFFFGIPAWVIGLVIVAMQLLTMIAVRSIGSLVSLLVSFVLVAILARSLGLLGDYDWIPGKRRARQTLAAAPKKSRQAARQERRRTSDAQRIDELLDKINANGIHSLSAAERRELQTLRERRKG
ncbi:rhomboid family intramembrane serine protease [Propionibacteriaceae bacterium Y1923]|uniref:rhomboid family intramembrane serine protease n=1 Tax=Aestuariimicrobium sp. Y1814 TaxID=3418742 RepID=UPI003C211820